MLFENPQDACDDYETDFAWMKRSGNMCWGMGAGRRIPCTRCGLSQGAHEDKRLEAEIERRRHDRAQTRED